MTPTDWAGDLSYKRNGGLYGKYYLEEPGSPHALETIETTEGCKQ